jgi:hypothetical protein
MDCLHTRRILRDGDDADAADRDLALAHLDDCRDCAALAPQLDPVLLFRRLPGVSVAPAEIARMRETVAVLRRAPADHDPRRVSGLALRLAAAIVAAAGLWLAPGPVAPERGAEAPGVPPARLAGAVPLPEYLPSVEPVGTSGPYVATHVSEDDLTLVIVANVDVAGR